MTGQVRITKSLLMMASCSSRLSSRNPTGSWGLTKCAEFHAALEEWPGGGQGKTGTAGSITAEAPWCPGLAEISQDSFQTA